MSVSTVPTVTLHVPPTVKRASVTYKMEHVLIVNLDGMEIIVIQVKWRI